MTQNKKSESLGQDSVNIYQTVPTTAIWLGSWFCSPTDKVGTHRQLLKLLVVMVSQYVW